MKTLEDLKLSTINRNAATFPDRAIELTFRTYPDLKDCDEQMQAEMIISLHKMLNKLITSNGALSSVTIGFNPNIDNDGQES